MHSDPRFVSLLADFPELSSPGVDWNKEVFAHFGLLFMGLGLLEHALINAVTFSRAAKAFPHTDRTQEAWAALIDDSFDQATKQTFGNLIRSLLENDFFQELGGPLRRTKGLRDYFAHHFMRQESDLMKHDEGCVLLLIRLNDARHDIKAVEVSLDSRVRQYFEHLKTPFPSESEIQARIAQLSLATQRDLLTGQAEVGWIRNAL
jgi:hypothetical protein